MIWTSGRRAGPVPEKVLDGGPQQTTPAQETAWSCSFKTFFPSSLMTKPNKLEGLPLETLSSQVLEF